MVEDDGWSDAMYYAVQCADYDYFPALADADARADAFLRYASESAGRPAAPRRRVLRRPAVHVLAGRVAEAPSGATTLVDAPFPTFILVGHGGPDHSGRERLSDRHAGSATRGCSSPRVVRT